MLQEYLAELSRYGEVNADYPYFDAYWEDDQRWPYLIELLANAYIQSGNLRKAVAAIEQGLGHSRSTGEYYFAAELTRLRGAVQLQLGNDPVEAEASFREAMNIAREQGAKTWEIKATQSLASVLDRLGRKREIDNDFEPVPAKLRRRPRGRRPVASRLP